MRAYLFLYRKNIKNRIYKILHRPSACIYTILICAYFIWLAVMMGGVIADGNFGTKQNLVRLTCALELYLTPANYAAYARRKGLLFLPGDVHFMFSSPLSPKGNLVYVYVKAMITSIVVMAAVFAAGIFWFHVPVGEMGLYVLVCNVLDAVLQGAIVVLLYGNEKAGKGWNRVFSGIMYGILGSLLVITAVILYKDGFGWDTFFRIFDGEWILMIPLIGWSLAAMRLIFLGPTTVNLACTVCYGAACILLPLLAWKMKCTGQYYEDAMKFADDYQEARQKSQKGEVAFVGKKKKYKKAQVVYKGSGAKAIFYRQVLESKKERFFIFGFVTLLYLAGGIAIGYLAGRDDTVVKSTARYYIIPGAMAYISFIWCSYKTRWTKELESPYTFLIPEPPFRKMWYATLLDHIRSAIHGVLFALPAMIGLEIELWFLPVFVLMQVSMTAAALYSGTVCSVLFGNIINDNIKRILHMFLYLAALMIAVFAAVVVTIFAGTWAGMGVVALYLAVFAGLMAWAGSRCFARMES